MIYFFSNIGYWYRAKLLKLDQDIAEVIFFDYGDKQNLPVEWIRRLSQKDRYSPPMAVHCKLSAVDLTITVLPILPLRTSHHLDLNLLLLKKLISYRRNPPHIQQTQTQMTILL